MRVLGVSAVADGDERHDTAPDIAAADGDEPRPTLVPPRLNGPASPSPALVTIMVIGQLRLP